MDLITRPEVLGVHDRWHVQIGIGGGKGSRPTRCGDVVTDAVEQDAAAAPTSDLCTRCLPSAGAVAEWVDL